MMKLYKIMFFNVMIIGTLVSISSYSWMGMWMGLEINLLSIIPLFYMNKNYYSSEASMKYFLAQAIASMIFLFSIISTMLSTDSIAPSMESMFLNTMNSALLIKMGTAPFHFWLPEVMEGLAWFNCLLVLTWQKIAPMILLMNNFLNTKFFFMVICLSLIISAILNLNQTSLRKILAYSSINHMGWMISTMMISSTIWLIYFSIYTMISINLIWLFNKTKSFYLNQLNNTLNKNKLLKISFMLNFLSLGGIPPFPGFIPKWFSVSWMISNNYTFLPFLMIMLTLFNLFIYLRILFSSIIINTVENLNNNKIKNYWLILTNLISLYSILIFTNLFNML